MSALPRRSHPAWRRWSDRWLAWDWKPWRWLYVSLDLTMLNLPRVRVDEDRPRCWIAFEYGNGNSDPVVLVTFTRRASGGQE